VNIDDEPRRSLRIASLARRGSHVEVCGKLNKDRLRLDIWNLMDRATHKPSSSASRHLAKNSKPSFIVFASH